MPGDNKPVPVIEDTAVDVHDLPEYIAEFNTLLTKHNLHSVHYAHAGSGEIHLRPIINSKQKRKPDVPHDCNRDCRTGEKISGFA